MTRLRQVVHVLRKDVRRFRPLILGVAGLLAGWATGVLPGMVPATGGGFVEMILAPAILAVFAALVIQEDRPAGDRAFWVTRPLAPPSLLAAKLLFVGLFLVLLPLFTDLVQVSRLGGEEPLETFVLPSLVYHGGLIAMAALAAAVTRDLRSFLLLLVGGGVAAMTLPQMASPGFQGEGRAVTVDHLTRVAWLGVGTALLAHQVLTRRTRRTVVTGVVLVVAAYVVIPRLGLDLSRPVDDPVVRRAFDGGGVVMTVAGLSLEPKGEGGYIPPDEIGLALQLEVRDSAGLRLVGRDAQVRVSGPGFEATFDRLDTPFGTSLLHRIRTLEGFEPIDVSGSVLPLAVVPRFAGAITVTAPEDEMTELMERGRRLEVTVGYDAYRSVVLGRLPLTEGASLSSSEGEFTLEAVSRAPGSLASVVVRRTVVPPLTTMGHSPDDVGFVLLNPGRREFLPAMVGGGGGGRDRLLSGIRVERRVHQLQFGQPRGPGLEGELDPRWLEGAELAVVGSEYLGSFELTTTLDDVTWPRVFNRTMPVRRER